MREKTALSTLPNMCWDVPLPPFRQLIHSCAKLVLEVGKGYYENVTMAIHIIGEHQLEHCKCIASQYKLTASTYLLFKVQIKIL